MAHTPGEWLVDGNCVVSPPQYKDGFTVPACMIVCTTEHDSCPEQTIAKYHPEEAAANLKLMAAAPDLLAACKFALDNLGNDCPDGELGPALVAAIALAEAKP